MRRKTVLTAAPSDVWRLVSDPGRLAEWWPGVARVEGVTGQSWTTVLSSPKGRTVRADYARVEAAEPERVVWRQELEGTPFERILASAVTTVELRPDDAGGTRVDITLDQRPRGWARFAPFQFRAAGTRQVSGALAGLRRHWGG